MTQVNVVFQVQQLFIYGWDAAPWSDGKGNLANLYASRQLAQEAIDELIDDVKDSVAIGDMGEAYDPNDYRVIAVDVITENELVSG